jgi:LysR family glycine cleavage system transcriptional activator
MSRIPLHPLQGFLTAARLRNLSRAADALHLTVSALSHQIRALEERLGQRLFDRGPRGITLTEDGERLHDAVAVHFDAIEHALRPSTRRADVLTLSLLPTLAASWLVPRLPLFLAKHPQLEINLQSSATLVDFARETSIDAALRFGKGLWPGVTAVHLFDDWLTPIASPALIVEHGGGRNTLHDLSRYPLLGDSGESWTKWFARFGGNAPARYVAVFSDTDTLHRAAVANMGVALGRMTLARPLIEAGLLRTLSPHRLKSDYAHYLVYPARSEHHAGLAAFRDWLLAQAHSYTTSLDAEASPRPKSKPRKPSR